MASPCLVSLVSVAIGLAALLSSPTPPFTSASWGTSDTEGLVVVPCDDSVSTPRVRFVAVGQGAAAVVDGGADDVVVIDSGPPRGAEALLAALESAGIRHVGLWVHTHFDADHAGGVTRVLAGLDGMDHTHDDVTVADAWDRGDDVLPATDVVSAYFRSRLAEVRVTPNDGELWASGIVTVRALRVTPDLPIADENSRGIAVCVDVGGLRLLVLGDLPSRHAEDVATSCPGADVLWVSHHGSADATSPALLEITSPTLAVVSAGDGNPYCHPAVITAARLADIPSVFTGVAATDPAAPCGDLASRWHPSHHWVGTDICVVPR